jgi:hypothetical protein
MSNISRPSTKEMIANYRVREAAVQRAVRAAVLKHARLGNPVATMRDGKVVWIQPAEILAEFAAEENGNAPQNGPPTAEG